MAETPRLSPGDKAPSFSLPSDAGETVSLEDLRGRKVVLYVYPAAMTPGCTKQACDFRDSLQRFADAGYAVIGLSPDKPSKLASFREKEGLTFPLLSDTEGTVATQFGVKRGLLGKLMPVKRTTFVIDTDRTVLDVISSEFSMDTHADKALETLRQRQSA